jgi:tetratricopeptide (TPR) repeat protein
MPARLSWIIVVCLSLSSRVELARAHDSPEHEIEALSEKMRANGASATLLARRATEWRSLRKLDRAQADLEQAIVLDPDSVGLQTELARVQAAQKRFDAARKTLERALTMAEEGMERCSVYMQRAEVREANGEHALAAEDCERAFSVPSPPLDWYLTRARLTGRTGRWLECARGLQEGFTKSGSIVLEIEWIEALIDAGQCREALDRIQPHAARARWKSGWLIRQGRAQAGMNAQAQAQISLKAALQELEARLDPAKPEGQLLAERGLAHALLGDRPNAAQDLEKARMLLGETAALASCIERLERVLGK